MLLPWDDLQQEIAGAAQALYRDGLSAAVSDKDAQTLFLSATEFINTGVPGSDLAVLQASLIWDATYAASEPPDWHGMVLLGAGLDGDVWQTPASPEGLRLLALLLTNNAIARSLCGIERAARYAPAIAATAVGYFEHLKDPAVRRWKAAALVVQAQYAEDPRFGRECAEKALKILAPMYEEAQELYVYATYLWGVGDGKVIEQPGRWGTPIGRKSRPASLSVKDLYFFQV